jgi:predicted PurR-regulated permease PerM
MLKQGGVNQVFKNVAIAIATVGLAYLVWQLSDLIILVITAIILATTFNPLVRWLEVRKISRKTGSAGVLVILVLPVIFVLVLIVPVFLEQIDNIAQSITTIISHYPMLPKVFANFDIAQYTKEAGQYVLLSTQALTTFVAEIIILVFMVYYLLIDAESLYKLAAVFIPEKNRQKTSLAIKELSEISGQYIRGNIYISLICTSVIFIGLTLLQVPGAIALALFAGITDLLPLIGATIGAIPAIILAFSVSPLVGILTIILFWLYQEIENDYIIPRVYHKALKIIPFLSFIAVIAGTLLFGIAGAFLSLPIAASIPTVMHYFFDVEQTAGLSKRLRKSHAK